MSETAGQELPDSGIVSTNPPLRDQVRSLVHALANTGALRGLVAMALGAAVLLAPRASTALVLVATIGVLALSGLMDLAYAASGRRWFGRRINRALAGLRGLVAVVLAVPLALVAFAGATRLSLVAAVEALGLYAGLRGAIAIVAAVSRRREKDPVPAIAGGSIAIMVGVLAVVVPASLTDAAIVTAAAGSLLVGAVLVAWSMRRDRGDTGRADTARGDGTLDPATASIPDVLWDWVVGSDIGRRERAAQAEGLYFENPGRLTKLGTWWVMLVLSVAIATFAVLGDSTAVVIGAMLVAPLMTPIMGLAGAIVNGWQRRAFQSAALVAAGVVVAITLGYGLSVWSPVAIAFDANSQILSRINPSTVDLLIALAAGAAGAFATVNSRVSSGLAGVAIAVALVPPLAVVGICLGGGRYADASGAFLLFLTNFVAIVLAAGLVFVLTGFARPWVLRNRPRQLALTVTPFVLLAGAILVPLMLTSEGLLATESRARVAEVTVAEWLGDDADLVITALTVDSREVQITVTGAGDPPDAADLSAALQEAFGEPVGLTLTVIPVEVTRIEAPA